MPLPYITEPIAKGIAEKEVKQAVGENADLDVKSVKAEELKLTTVTQVYQEDSTGNAVEAFRVWLCNR